MKNRPKEPAPIPHQPPRLREIFAEHGPFVVRSLRRLGIPDADLDDALQEVFMVVYQRLADYEERGRTRSWLYSICTRVALAIRRKVARRRESLQAEPDEQASQSTQHEHMEDREALTLGKHVLAQLPEEQREVFVLYEVEGMSMTEIADAIGCPLQTGYSRLRAARQRVLSEVERLRSQGEQP